MPRNNRPPRVAVYLPSSEPCSAFRGGALSTWTRKIYAEIGSDFQTFVFATEFDGPVSGFESVIVKKPAIANRLAAVLRNRSMRSLLDSLKLQLSIAYAKRVAKAVKAFKPDIVHIHNDPLAVLPIRKWNPGTKIVLHMNNDHIVEGIGDKRLVATLIRSMEKIVFCSEFIKRNALAHVTTLEKGKCEVVYNGTHVVPKNFRRLEPVFSRSDSPKLLFIGRLVPEKGIHVLLDAMTLVLAAYPKAELKIVGGVYFGSSTTNEYLEKLKNAASRFGNSILFEGAISHDHIHDCFSNADLFVCPSIWNEPLGMVNLEAMGAGVPVVAFSNGGIPEAIGDAGVLVRDNEANALARAIVALIKDRDLRQSLSERGHLRALNLFSWPVIAEKWRTCVETILGVASANRLP